MKDGIYHVTFNSQSGMGEGIVVVAGSKVNGGDDGYTYQGSVVAAADQVSGVLTVNRHAAGATSVFGDISDFILRLKGTHSDRGFQLTGSVDGIPQAQIQINGRWLRSLAP
ncbi:MAG: GrlR family regulatory protein [Pseudomonadota bacterium]